MEDKTLETFYEIVILPCYEGVIKFGKITWLSHGKVDLDAWAHHFEADGKKYVLLYEDFPGRTYFDDELSHEVVKLGEKASIELKFSDNRRQIPNVLGWYTLYQEKSR